MNERGKRRFSQAISEGDGISVVAEATSVDDAERAAAAGAEAVVVRAGVAGLADRVELPLLSHAREVDADAVVLRTRSADDDELLTHYADVLEQGRECVVEVRNEEELERVLELLDPEIVLLASDGHDDEKLDDVLDLLPDVPAGKLVIADVGAPDGDGVAGLERVGVDAVIVAARDVASVVGVGSPDV